MEKGQIYTLSHIVTDSETADKIGSGGLPVFSTPSLIALMEKTSFLLAAEDGQQTVGTKVEIAHLKASKVGTELVSTAELLDVDGRKLRFKVSVNDEIGLVGEGFHERFVIDPERFMAKLG